MRAYHFLKEDMTTPFTDEPPWRKGETRTWDGECVLYESGYHSSATWFDALRGAMGPIACIVDISRPIQKRGKLIQVSRTRTLVDYRDATKPLLTFACDCANRAVERSTLPEHVLMPIWLLLEAKRAWIEGQVPDSFLKKAQRDVELLHLERESANLLAVIAMQAAAMPNPLANGPAQRARQAALHCAVQVPDTASELQWLHRRFGQLMRGLFNEVGN